MPVNYEDKRFARYWTRHIRRIIDQWQAPLKTYMCQRQTS